MLHLFNLTSFKELCLKISLERYNYNVAFDLIKRELQWFLFISLNEHRMENNEKDG